ncbi:hypothetical protein V8C86DRAFT_2531564 [Haematococcus lacustris]
MGKKVAPAAIKTNLFAFSNLAVYSVLMMLVPFFLFWMSVEHYLDPVYAWTIGIPAPEKLSLVSGVVAVIGVNIVVACFIFTAFKDEDAKPADKED